MDTDKLSKWIEIAKQFSGGEFWTDIFEQPAAEKVIGQNPYFRPAPDQSAAPDIRVDILRQGDEMIVLIDIPGMAKEDIELALSGDHLFVRGTPMPLFPQADVISSQRVQGAFERSIGLPEKAVTELSRIRAAYQRGVLIVRIPIMAVPFKPITIE